MTVNPLKQLKKSSSVLEQCFGFLCCIRVHIWNIVPGIPQKKCLTFTAFSKAIRKPYRLKSSNAAIPLPQGYERGLKDPRANQVAVEPQAYPPFV